MELNSNQNVKTKINEPKMINKLLGFEVGDVVGDVEGQVEGHS